MATLRISLCKHFWYYNTAASNFVSKELFPKKNKIFYKEVSVFHYYSMLVLYNLTHKIDTLDVGMFV